MLWCGAGWAADASDRLSTAQLVGEALWPLPALAGGTGMVGEGARAVLGEVQQAMMLAGMDITVLSGLHAGGGDTDGGPNLAAWNV